VDQYRAWASDAVGALQRWYNPRTGLWKTAGWWNSANALTAVIQHSQRTGEHACLVNDGLTADCANNGRTTWTYNQGVIIGGLAVLYEITSDEAYLGQAETIAAAALRHLTVPPGILTEPGERETGRRDRDRPQFKGIFVRHLYELCRHRPRAGYHDFIVANATSLWRNSRNRRNQVGLAWTGPFDRADAVRQASALDVLNAAVGVTDPAASGPAS
jgi:predicted alpha-1,6-mannanase (GH76 family)